MNILFLSHYFPPHIGGVEKHVLEVGKSLLKKGHNVTVVTEKYDKNLNETEEIDNIKVVRLYVNKTKYISLIKIWFWFLKNRELIKNADVIHCHDVFIWYLPFRFIYPKKKIFTTIHGLEWDDPLSKISVWQKKITAKFSNRTIGVGLFLEKYLGIKFDLLIYGATNLQRNSFVKQLKTIVYIGRLEENTGLLKFLKWCRNNRYKVDFCGDGKLKEECEKFGTVHGFTDPSPFYEKAKYCVPGGYLAALEALSYGCELKLFWNNKVKEDYWKMSPFIDKDVNTWVKKQTWDKLANEYLNLYKFSDDTNK